MMKSAVAGDSKIKKKFYNIKNRIYKLFIRKDIKIRFFFFFLFLLCRLILMEYNLNVCRLIKGDGEVIEEIVSKEKHHQINRQATLGDGLYFQRKINNEKR